MHSGIGPCDVRGVSKKSKAVEEGGGRRSAAKQEDVPVKRCSVSLECQCLKDVPVFWKTVRGSGNGWVRLATTSCGDYVNLMKFVFTIATFSLS